ncbi:MAG: acetylglutamate kinase [Lutibacter sp.]
MAKQNRKLQVVKIGGNIIENTALLNRTLNNFKNLKSPKILIHGGGKSATRLADKLGVPIKMVNGRRVTDQSNLEIAVMVYAGLINKSIVANLQSLNCNAIGLSGADMNSIEAKKRAAHVVDFGFVGDVENINTSSIELLLENNVIPVFCAISHDKNGQLLNTNADTIAAEIAASLSEKYQVELNYIFEFKGVLSSIEDKKSVIPTINLKKYKQLVQQKVIKDGMLPKIDNCFSALIKGVEKVKIGDVSILENSANLFTTLILE